MTLEELAVQMEQLPSRIEAASSQVAKDVATAVAFDLFNVTPVDVGDAMSSWIVTVGQPAFENRKAFAPSPKGRMIGGRWTHTVDPTITFQNNIGPAMDVTKTTLSAKAPGEPIYINSNNEYIGVLDSGTSEQQPAGFIDRALIVGKSVASSAKLKL